MMDIALGISAVILVLVGLAGCIVPVMPGPPLSYVGLLLVYWSAFGDYTLNFMITWAVITAMVTVLDYYLPIYMTRRFGGSREAAIGSMLGVVAGLFLFPPVGVVVMPFVGALIGELMHDSSDMSKALRVAFGSFAAFITGTGAKLIVSGVIAFFVFRSVITALYEAF